MIRIATPVVAGVLACIAVTHPLAGESLEELKEQRAEIGPKRKELQDEQRKLSAAIGQSKAMADAHEAVADAKKKLDDELAANRTLKKAREAEAEAAAQLRKLVDERTSDSKHVKTAHEEKIELADRRRQQQFDAGLLQRRLYANNSPLRAEARHDRLVRAAAKAVRELRRDVAENPLKAVTKAKEKLDEARREENERWQELQDNRKLKKAREEERDARETLREAERDDKRRAAAKEARAGYDEARREAYEDIRDARGFLKELREIDEEQTDIKNKISIINSLLDVHRAVLREDGPRSVRKAAAKVESAQKKYDKETDSKELKELHERRKETWAAAEAAEVGYLQMKAPDLMAEREELWTKRDELKQKLAKGKSVSKDLAKILIKLREINAKLGALHARHNARDYGRLRGIWSGAKAAHVAKLNADPDIVEAQQELDAARRELDAAVEEELGDVKAAGELFEERAKLDARLALLGFEADIAGYQLYDRYSPLKVKVDSDRSVIKAHAKWRELEDDIRQDPTRAVEKARKACDEARGTVREIEQELRQDKGYRKAYEARREAEAALKEANASDPRNKKLAEALKAHNNLLDRTIGALEKAQRLLHQQRELEKKREETEAAIRAADDKIRATRTAIERGEDKDVVKARKALDEARAAVKTTENSGRILELRKAYDKARQDRDGELRKLLTDNKNYRRIQTELDELAKLDRRLSNRIRVLTKQARNVEKKSEE